MCARKMVITDPGRLRTIFGVTHGATPNFAPRWNLPITERDPIVRMQESGRSLELATWDYRDDKTTTLKGRKPVFNMRGEPMSRSAAFAGRRCLVPCDGFYEWATINGKKFPFAFRREDGEPFAMGGVWSDWRKPEGGSELTYVELTVEPCRLVAEIHARMPLIVDRADWEAWLEGPSEAARGLVKPNPMTEFVRFAVSLKVNSVKNEGPELIEPVRMPEPVHDLFR
jgi:putative SOS response-associated peptidase YedK